MFCIYLLATNGTAKYCINKLMLKIKNFVLFQHISILATNITKTNKEKFFFIYKKYFLAKS